MNSSKGYAGLVVIVTGASQGIGRAFCLEIAGAKPKLVVAARNQARLEELAGEARKRGAEVLAVVTDVSKRQDCEQLIKAAVHRFGRIDVLVNNAGITMWANFDETKDLALVERVMSVNFASVAYCTHYALPFLTESKGRLVGVSSLAGVLGVPGHVIYGASKHAVVGFFDALRVELKSQGVSVTVICPDFVVTDIHMVGLKGDGTPMGKRLPDGKFMAPETCARLMAHAIAGRKRHLFTSLRGRLAYFVRGLFPSLIDTIVAHQTKKAALH